jgi:hypothetical protein
MPQAFKCICSVSCIATFLAITKRKLPWLRNDPCTINNKHYTATIPFFF